VKRDPHARLRRDPEFDLGMQRRIVATQDDKIDFGRHLDALASETEIASRD
jgi:hypothetical protein